MSKTPPENTSPAMVPQGSTVAGTSRKPGVTQRLKPTAKPSKPPGIAADATPNRIVKHRAARRPPVVKKRECIVCCSSKAANQFPKQPHAAANSHASDVCFTCWDQHFQSEAEVKSLESVGCAQCPATLTTPEVQKLARNKTFAALLDKVTKRYIRQDEEFHACPTASCSWGAFFAKDDGNILACPQCSSRYCLSCEVPFHEGLTCAEHIAQGRREQDHELSVQEVAKISKPCPRCGVNVDKYTGCDHVTCRCRHQFCWECAAPYTGVRGIFVIGNTAHLDSCMYSPAQLPNAPGELTRP